MIKPYKFLIFFVLTLAITAITLDVYWSKKHKIYFAKKIPQSISYCGRTLTDQDQEYTELITWLRHNKKGWENTFLSYVPATVFESTDISINVTQNDVIINFTTRDYEWGQVKKEKKSDELTMLC